MNIFAPETQAASVIKKLLHYTLSQGSTTVMNLSTKCRIV